MAELRDHFFTCMCLIFGMTWQDQRHAKLSSAAVFVRKLHDLAGLLPAAVWSTVFSIFIYFWF